MNKPHFIIGTIETAAGPVPRVSTRLLRRDILGAWKARWGVNRMKYKINPGLYAVGNPDEESPVLITANYKLTFDKLRARLAGLSAWIMVLDTRGINVWCAAGKGTFGTEEVVRRIREVKLAEVVSHRTLLLPQLSAPGVAAHLILKESGFRVLFGPVRASDIPEFFRRGKKATPQMRTVRFNLWDRLLLTPIELAGVARPALLILGVLAVLQLLGLDVLSLGAVLPYAGAVLVGAVVVPALLPWIPGRAFSLKGWLMGVALVAAYAINMGWILSPSPQWQPPLVYFFLLPAISAFLAMNFTGSTTFTSLSGVVKEMRIALPAIILSVVLGLGVWVVLLVT